MTKHEGQHPRMGATDVIPFVPQMDVTLEECIEMSRRVAKRIWDELGQPFSPLPAFGEDLSACIRIRELGGKIVCDSRVKVQHIGLFPIGEEYLDD